MLACKLLQVQLTNPPASFCNAEAGAHGHTAVAAVERRHAPKKQERDRHRQAAVEPAQLLPVARVHGPLVRGGGGRVRQAGAVVPPPHRELVAAQLLLLILVGVTDED